MGSPAYNFMPGEPSIRPAAYGLTSPDWLDRLTEFASLPHRIASGMIQRMGFNQNDLDALGMAMGANGQFQGQGAMTLTPQTFPKFKKKMNENAEYLSQGKYLPSNILAALAFLKTRYPSFTDRFLNSPGTIAGVKTFGADKIMTPPGTNVNPASYNSIENIIKMYTTPQERNPNRSGVDLPAISNRVSDLAHELRHYQQFNTPRYPDSEAKIGPYPFGTAIELVNKMNDHPELADQIIAEYNKIPHEASAYKTGDLAKRQFGKYIKMLRSE